METNKTKLQVVFDELWDHLQEPNNSEPNLISNMRQQVRQRLVISGLEQMFLTKESIRGVILAQSEFIVRRMQDTNAPWVIPTNFLFGNSLTVVQTANQQTIYEVLLDELRIMTYMLSNLEGWE